MSGLISLVIALALSAGLSTYADAAPVKRKRPHHTSDVVHSSNRMAENGYSGYYERVLDRVPFGSQLWWRVYDSMPKGR